MTRRRRGNAGRGVPGRAFPSRISPASAQGRRNAPGAPVVPPPALRAAHRAVSVPSVFYTLCAPQADSSLLLSSLQPESQGDGAEGDRQEEPGGDLQGEIEGIILAQPVPFAAHFSPEGRLYIRQSLPSLNQKLRVPTNSFHFETPLVHLDSLHSTTWYLVERRIHPRGILD